MKRIYFKTHHFNQNPGPKLSPDRTGRKVPTSYVGMVRSKIVGEADDKLPGD